MMFYFNLVLVSGLLIFVAVVATAGADVPDEIRHHAGSCICPSVYHPVCGDDGNTYSNPCQAACKEVEVVSDGPCRIPKLSSRLHGA